MSDTAPKFWAGTGADFGLLNTLESGPLVIGYNLGAFVADRVDPIAYTKQFFNFSQDAISKNGIFTNLAPTSGYYRSYEHDRSHYFSDGDGFARIYIAPYNKYVRFNIGEKDTLLQNTQTMVLPLVERYNRFLDYNNFSNTPLNLKHNNFDNTLILGPSSNLKTSLGDGNNVILMSPNATVYTAGYIAEGSRPGLSDYSNNKTYTPVFYPASQGKLHSNELELGSGNNLVYYDASLNKVKTGDGNNIFAPSFGSFNWAINDAHFYYERTKWQENLSPSSRTLLTPTPLDGNKTSYNEGDVYTYVYNWQSHLSDLSKENAF